MEYGLIGGVLGHSYSKTIHEYIADYSYELKELDPSELDGFMKARDFKGINVTIPYKQDVIPYLDEIDDNAKRIGAVNTVVNRAGKLYGYNTDFMGMKALALKNGISMEGKKVMILGTGGTSKTAHSVAEELGAAEILHVSRKLSDIRKAYMEEKGLAVPITYKEAETIHNDAQVIINTTPAGMYPNVETCLIDVSCFPSLSGVLDAVYNPLRSKLVLNAQTKGVPAAGGLYMLAAQAVYAIGFFLNQKACVEDIERAYQYVLKEKQNIVLCGMPSCGKTTISEKLKDLLGMDVIDTDEQIVKRIGMEIAEFSALHGEQAFRDVESEVVKEVSFESGKIIATGGGAILRDENVRALKQNGLLVFIDRPLEKLVATPDRPFSADPEALKKRYEERYDRYCEVADVTVDGSGSVEEVAALILDIL